MHGTMVGFNEVEANTKNAFFSVFFFFFECDLSLPLIIIHKSKLVQSKAHKEFR
jgi:hypothetical protein